MSGRGCPPNYSLMERLDGKYTYDESGCWLWKANTNGCGYGVITKKAQTLYAHRIMYRAVKGEIPAGLELDHLCRIRSCINPSHLEPVTHSENLARGLIGMKTHCLRGHQYTPENTITKNGGNGRRACKACHRECERNRARRLSAQCKLQESE